MLKITERKAATLLFHFSVPTAKWIEKHEPAKPRCINYPQRESGIGRRAGCPSGKIQKEIIDALARQIIESKAESVRDEHLQ